MSPDEPEVHGLVALMELQSSRLAARLGPAGEIVLLADQDRRRWDRLHIHLGLTALAHAEALRPDLGPYALQAAIAACHSQASSIEDTDWRQIVRLYDRLAEPARSPVVELNRAVAVSMASGPTAGLAIVDSIGATGALDGYHLFHSVRGDLLEKVGREHEAADAFALAATLARNDAERALSENRARALRLDPCTGSP
jgi:predicted RNA polymerase sigma factor